MQLRLYHVGGRCMNSGYRHGVLSGKRGNDTRTINAQGTEGFQIGLNTGATTRIGTGDR